ncbi:MAG: hypothetical protein ABIR24_05785, partial [Verrucomicrobiota bacterium]
MFAIRYFVFYSTLLVAFLGNAASPSPEPVAKLAIPAIRSLRLEPASLTLLNGRDKRRVLVIGETVSGQKIDLTGEAKLEADSDVVEIANGCVQARSKGETRISISAAGRMTKLPVKVASAEIPSVGFVRDVEPLLAKVGCNAGTCHGSAKGKNGFKLSLRGYDPDFDYQALINDLSGRRFSRVKVEESLMLLKPTAEVPHEGRQVLKPNSAEYNLLKQWIAEGTKFEEPSKRATKIEVLPAEIELDLAGRSHQILVIAYYADGTTRDVTGEAIMSSNNPEVLGVTNNVATGIRRGEGAVLVRYEGNYTTRLIT